jgi:hypothetical protein
MHSPDRHAEKVWSHLKKVCSEGGWRCGIYEEDKYVEVQFQIAENVWEKHFYFVMDDRIKFRVRVVEEFDEDQAIDVFILAQHFNNVLNNGKVVVSPEHRYLEYVQTRDILVPLLYDDELYLQMNRHHDTAKDVYTCFQRLLVEQVEPAIIIADLLAVRRQ